MPSCSLALTAGDFDAYLPERATSNAFSRPRLEFKQRAQSWARQAVDRLRVSNIQVDTDASDEHPSVHNGHRVDCQWVYFWRPREQRLIIDVLLDRRAGIAAALREASPHSRHAFLGMRLDAEKIEVFAQLPPEAWVDGEAFRARLVDDNSARSVVNAIAALPEQFQLGLSSQTTKPVASVSVAALREIDDQQQSNGLAIWVGWTVNRDQALEHAEILGERLSDALAALAPVYQMLSWQRDDDISGIGNKLDSMHAELAQIAANRTETERKKLEQSERSRQELTERSRERTRERLEYNARRHRPTLATLFKPVARVAEVRVADAPSADVPLADAPLANAPLANAPPAIVPLADAPPAVVPLAEVRSDAVPLTEASPTDSLPPNSTPATHPIASAPAEASHTDSPVPTASAHVPPAAIPHDQSDVPRIHDRKPHTVPPIVHRDSVPAIDHSASVSATPPTGTIDKGTQIRVVSGPFAGKIGVVGDVDGKGGVRVLLGLLSARLPAEWLEPVVDTKEAKEAKEAKERPAIQSSHRRDGMLGRTGK